MFHLLLCCSRKEKLGVQCDFSGEGCMLMFLCLGDVMQVAERLTVYPVLK